jgi:hypothetical protein
MTNSTYSRRSQTVSRVKESQARTPTACRRRNDRQLVWARRGAGSTPWARSTRRIELADTRHPRSRVENDLGGCVVCGQPACKLLVDSFSGVSPR